MPIPTDFSSVISSYCALGVFLSNNSLVHEYAVIPGSTWNPHLLVRVLFSEAYAILDGVLKTVSVSLDGPGQLLMTTMSLMSFLSVLT